MTLDDFLDKCVAKYGGKPKKAGAGFLVRCPVPKHKHGDRKPSLSVRDGRRWLLIKCFTGCDEADILAALDIKKSALVNDAKSPKSKPTSKSKKSKTRVGRGSTPPFRLQPCNRRGIPEHRRAPHRLQRIPTRMQPCNRAARWPPTPKRRSSSSTS